MSTSFKTLIEQGFALVYIDDVLLLSNSKEHMFQFVKQLHFIISSSSSSSIIRNGGLQSMLTPPFSVKCHFFELLMCKTPVIFFHWNRNANNQKELFHAFAQQLI